MGIYVNPGNQAFRRIAGPCYVDKTDLISHVNDRIGGDECLVCICRPRRFGKSYAAKMLTAYYDTSCDSRPLFDDKKIAGYESYDEHINKYNVICLDIAGFVSAARRDNISLSDVPSRIASAIKEEILMLDPEAPKDRSLEDCLIHCVDRPGGKPFIFIIDEWELSYKQCHLVSVVPKNQSLHRIL